MRCFVWLLATGVILAGLGSAWGQTPLPPPPPVVLPAQPVGGGFLSSLCASCAARKQAICNGPLGRLLKNALGPLSALTGGMVPGEAGPSKQELAAPGTVGAAAKIKADQKAAAARREAVRFLGTIDCHWYPEAEAGLIAALRIDRSECVRFEAARSLARGCCCTKGTMEALSICISGSDRDGNPGENSLRVQLMALEALQRCVTAYPALPAEGALPRPEHPAAAVQPDSDAELPEVRFTAYYEKIRSTPPEQILAHAGRVVAQAHQREAASVAPSRRAGSLLELWQEAEK